MSGNEPSETASSGQDEETPSDDDAAASSGEATPPSGAESDESSANGVDAAGSAMSADVHDDAAARSTIVPDEQVPDDVTTSDLTIEPRGWTPASGSSGYSRG